MRLLLSSLALFGGLLIGVILILAAEHGNIEDPKLSIGAAILGVFVFVATIGLALLACEYFPAWCPDVGEILAIFFS